MFVFVSIYKTLQFVYYKNIDFLYINNSWYLRYIIIMSHSSFIYIIYNFVLVNYDIY